MSRMARWSGWLAGVALALGLAGCGADPYASLDLTLRFSPETIPPDTDRLSVYLLPSLITVDNVEEAIDCDLFVGPTRSKEVYDYSPHLLKPPVTVDFDPSTATAISLKNLAVGLTVFVVEALDASSNVLAVGCGKGQIERGDKTFIPIYLEDR